MKRDSNIELLRILAMFMIVVHHYCVNSGLTQLFDYSNITANMVLIQFMSFGGKVGVNIFFIISGFFMINGVFKLEKITKLVFQVLFYCLLTTLFLYLLGYQFSPKMIAKGIILPFVGTYNFIAAYLLVYILSPIVNKMLKQLECKEFLFLLLVLLTYFSIFSTFLNRDTWNYFGWGLTLYGVGAFIKLHGNEVKILVFRSKPAKASLICWGGGVVSLLLIWASMLTVDFVGTKFGFDNWNYMIGQGNKILGFSCALFMFLTFKDIKIAYNKIINVIAASAFGVLLIHANSDTMRTFLWRDLLRNTEWYNSPYLWIHMLLSCVAIYAVCTCIDILRIKFFRLFRDKLKLRGGL